MNQHPYRTALALALAAVLLPDTSPAFTSLTEGKKLKTVDKSNPRSDKALFGWPCDQEIEALRRDLAGLQGELQYQRSEQSAAAEAFASVLNQLTELQKPLSEVHRRLAAAQPGIINGGVHA